MIFLSIARRWLLFLLNLPYATVVSSFFPYSRKRNITLLHCEGETELFQFFHNFFQRFATQISDFHHIFFGTLDQFLYRVDSCPFQAVVRPKPTYPALRWSYQEVYLYCHPLFRHNNVAAGNFRKANKEFQIFRQDFGADAQRFIRSDASVSPNIQESNDQSQSVDRHRNYPHGKSLW